MRAFFTYGGLVFVALAFLFSCQGGAGCRDLTGIWSDREGHGFVFQNNGKALWLNKFGQMVDTVTFVFTLNCKTKPASVDFRDFSSGPFMGKTLFGIIEWSADSLFRLCYEVGQDPECRPKQFDVDQTMKFYK